MSRILKKISKTSCYNSIFIGAITLWHSMLYFNYTGGDQLIYRETYAGLSGNLKADTTHYFKSLFALDFIHFLYIYTTSLFKLNHFISITLINFILVRLTNGFLDARGCGAVNRAAFLTLNFYFLVILIPAERLKFLILLLILTATYKKLITGFFSLASHLQSIMLLPAYWYFLSFRKRLVFLIILIVLIVPSLMLLFPSGTFNKIIYKFNHYQSTSDLQDFYLFMLFFSINVVIGLRKFDLLFHGYIILCLLVFGSDRVGIIYYFAFLVLTSKRLIKSPYFTLINAIFCIKGALFILNIFNHGNGYGTS
jgi:hypothetical protein